MSELELVVFDVAGTTIAVADQVPEALQVAFERVGVRPEPGEISGMRGKSKRQAIAGLLARHGKPARIVDVERVHADFENCLANLLRTYGVSPIPGARETFQWLRNKDIRFALATGFDGSLVQPLLEQVGWADVVDAVVCNDDVARGRPAPDLIFEAMRRTGVRNASRVAAVGDTVSDLRAAEAAGVRWSIGVLSGAHSHEQLSACQHTAIIDSVADLPQLLDR